MRSDRGGGGADAAASTNRAKNLKNAAPKGAAAGGRKDENPFSALPSLRETAVPPGEPLTGSCKVALWA